MKKILLVSAALASSALIATGASAATQSVSAGVNFISPLAISNVVNANFGSVTAGVASTKYVLDTSGNVTVASGPGIVVTGAKNAASFTISGSSTQTINISAGSYTANGGVTPSAATCKYGAGTAAACTAAAFSTAAAPAAGTTLAMGLTITTTGNETGGTTANPSFTMTVVYN